MSIFPKRVSSGEYVIVHLNFKGIFTKNKKISYCLNIFDPDNKQICNLKNEIIMLGNNKEYEKQLYYPILIKKDFLAGKYIVEFYLLVDGKKILSRTINNDYFIVEKIDCNIDYENKKLVIKNMSSLDTAIKLILEKDCKFDEELILLNSDEEKHILIDSEVNSILIMYGNDKLEQIPYSVKRIFD